VSLTGWLADDWAAASNALTSHPCYFEGTQRASAPWTYILLSTLLVVRTLTPSGIILDQDPITKREITPAKKCRFGDTTVTGTGTEISQRPDRPAFTSKAQTPHFIMKWWWGGSGSSIQKSNTQDELQDWGAAPTSPDMTCIPNGVCFPAAQTGRQAVDVLADGHCRISETRAKSQSNPMHRRAMA
jgi:hypothetical protein